MRADHDVPEVARYQEGAFTRAQAVAEGWSHDQVDRRLVAGSWLVVCGPALAEKGGITARTRAWAAHLAWPDAVVSHLTAAEIHRFPVPRSSVVHVIAPQRRHSIRGAKVHRVALGPKDAVVLGRGPRLTSRRRTAIDCLRLLPPDDGLRLWAWLSTREVIDRAELAAEVARTRGLRGTPKLVNVLQKTEGGALSHQEQVLHGLLRAAGLTGWVANAPIAVDGRRVAVVDVLFEREKLVIEVDGYEAHSGRDAFVKDRRRQNLLLGAGYLVLRFTWDDLTQRPTEVVRQIAGALAGRR